MLVVPVEAYVCILLRFTLPVPVAVKLTLLVLTLLLIILEVNETLPASKRLVVIPVLVIVVLTSPLVLNLIVLSLFPGVSSAVMLVVLDTSYKLLKLSNP